MAKRLDHVLVIDIESTCWDGGFPPRGEANDIIEIGLTGWNSAAGGGWRSEASWYAERSKVSPFCTSLTTLTQSR